MICFANMQIEVLDNLYCKMMLWTIVGNCDNLLYYESLQINFLQLLQFLVGVSFLANLINCGSGKFVCKINKLLLRTPFLHIVQMFGFGHLFFETFADIPSGHIFANCRSGQLFVCPSPLSNIFYSFSFSPPLTKYFTSSNGLPLADDQCVH